MSHLKSFQFIVNGFNEAVFPTEQGVFFTCGLSDVTSIIGTDAELVCRLSKEDCDTVWYKDGNEVRDTAVYEGTLFILTVENVLHVFVGPHFRYQLQTI